MVKKGRKTIQVDWVTVDKLAMIHCTGPEIAGFLNIDEDTLTAAAKRDHGVLFSEYLAKKRANGRASLRRSQWLLATEAKNPTMLIFLGKQYLGQKDVQDIQQTVTTNEVKITEHNLLELIKEASKKE